MEFPKFLRRRQKSRVLSLGSDEIIKPLEVANSQLSQGYKPIDCPDCGISLRARAMFSHKKVCPGKRRKKK